MLLLILTHLGGLAVQAQTAPPPPVAGGTTPAAVIDAPVQATLRAHGASLRDPCPDAVFIRRVYVDVIGTLPTPEAVTSFLEDTRPEKRALLIEELLQRPEFADLWALKWCDLLRVKSEFPINLWPNAVQAYHKWIHDAVRDNLPYDQFARALLTSSGSNFRVPPVNFYRAIQGRDPSAIAGAVALTFMGARVDRWPEARRTGMTTLFSRVAYKKTGEWKEEIVFTDPAATGSLHAVFPDGTPALLTAEQDPREAFATWLLAPRNPWFARCMVNRLWYWLLGRGIIHEPDDIRPDNPIASPELLASLEAELIRSRYDLRHLYRLILNSRTYQQSVLPTGPAETDQTRFARYTIRRMDAEVLIDALDWLGGSGEDYSSPIPEPFTFIPNTQRTITLADGSITSHFLETFGRPNRDTGLLAERNNDPSDAQRLHLLNSGEIRRRIDNSPRLLKILTASRWRAPETIRGLYLTILSRPPTPDEAATAAKYFQTNGLQVKGAAMDLAWALINSKEFLYRH
jgi:hypothetical protein